MASIAAGAGGKRTVKREDAQATSGKPPSGLGGLVPERFRSGPRSRHHQGRGLCALVAVVVQPTRASPTGCGASAPREMGRDRGSSGNRTFAQASAPTEIDGPVAARFWSAGPRPQQSCEDPRRQIRPATSILHSDSFSLSACSRSFARYHWQAGADHFSMRMQSGVCGSDPGRPPGDIFWLNIISL